MTRVVEQNSVYKSTGFSYLNNFTYLNTNYKKKAAWIVEDPVYKQWWAVVIALFRL